MGHLVAVACIPDEALLVSGYLQRVAEESVVGLIFCADIGLNVALGQCGLSMEDDHACHCVGAVHQRGRTLQDFHRADAAAVHFYAMFVAPLLSFLAHALAHYHYTVVAQSADDGFRDAASCGQLADTWLMGNGVNDVRRCC